MTYKWALAGEIITPYIISESELVGTPVKAEREPFELAKFFLDDKKYFPFLDDFWIGKMPSLKTLDKVFYNGVFVLDLGLNLVATSSDGSSYLDKDYRGRGLGAEILAELYTAYPEILVKRHQFPHLTKAYSHSGLAAVKKAYKLMFRRGAVVPSYAFLEAQKYG